jgi:hypothetical protein
VTAGIVRQRISSDSFASIRHRFEALYLRAFPPEQRRRIGPSAVDDDGLLPGSCIESLLESERLRFEAYLDGDEVVGIMLTFDLGSVSLADYLAREMDRPDLAGLGPRMLRDWLVETEARDQDAVSEVEPPGTAPDPEAPGLSADEQRRRRSLARTRRRRLLTLERHGFYMLDQIDYALPGRVAMSLGLRPRPSRPARSEGRSRIPQFAPGEVEEIVRTVSATYR